MFEKFTERARRAIVLAQKEARGLQRNYIGTEHVLLGLLREEEGIAARVLESFDVTLERVRAQVIRIVGSGQDLVPGQIPFTPRAKRVLELAMREALSFGHHYVGTEHILLGVARENEGVAARILLDFDLDAETVRDEVTARFNGPGPNLGRDAPGSAEASTLRLGESGWLDGLGGVLDDLAAEIHGEPKRAPDTGDLLIALASASATPAGQALREFGVSLDQLTSAVQRVRAQAQAGDELARGLQGLNEAKRQAVGTLDLLRDQERELRRQVAARTATPPEVVQEIRLRVGLPTAAPEPPRSS